MDRRPGRGVLLLLVGALFVLVAGVAATADPRLERVPVPRMEPWPGAPSGDQATTDPDAERGGEVTEPDPAPGLFDSPELGWLAGVGLLLIAGLVLVLLWRTLGDRVTLRRTEVGAAGEARRKEQVRAAVAAGIDELDADGSDPRAAVIGCWLRLERAAAAAGIRREPSDTPGELIARMLAEHDVSAPVLDRFAAVYRRARYAPHEIGEPMRDEARAALHRVHADLTRATPTEAVDR